MTQLLTNAERHLAEKSTLSIGRCPECGSFLDAPRMNPTTGSIARKCMACEVWHAPVPSKWEGSD
jgi:hypothetical protein